MIGPKGPSKAETWLAEAQLAAARDLVSRLRACPPVKSVTVLLGEASAERQFPEPDLALRKPSSPFHFGEELARWIREQERGPVAYLGGAAAPLLTTERLDTLFQMLTSNGPRLAQVNNLHSTDWLMLDGWDEDVLEYLSTQRVDNGLGWGLRQDYNYEVISHPALAAFRADIDTPADAALVRGHPDLGPRLSSYLEAAAGQAIFARLEGVESVMTRPGGHLAVIGRTSSGAWRSLESNTQLWVRILAEERGMLASGRLHRGEVKTLLSPIIAAQGIDGFVESLSSLAEAVIWDNRVWMASRGSMPTAADRFASDLGWSPEVIDRELRRLSEAIEAAPIPILTGGHGVVAGSLLAYLETLASRGSLPGNYQPSR